MHFAICVWGIVRSLRFTVDSMKQYCLEPITHAGHTYEIFMHTYRFSGEYSNHRSGENKLRLNFDDWKLLNPDHIFLEDQDEFDRNTNYTSYQTLGDPWNNGFTSFTNHIRALHSLHYLAKSVEEASKKTHFDGVVFLRPDVTYMNELPFYLLEHFSDTLFVPDFHRSCKGDEYNDRMVMGNLATALAFGKRFEHALEYSQRKKLHSEKFAYDHLQEQNITVMEIPFRFKRTRANGLFNERDEAGVISPYSQKPNRPYTTSVALRLVYSAIEEVTDHKVYVWNHDDDMNLYCKPHPHLTWEDCLQFRRVSRNQRYPQLKQNQQQQRQRHYVGQHSNNGLRGAGDSSTPCGRRKTLCKSGNIGESERVSSASVSH